MYQPQQAVEIPKPIRPPATRKYPFDKLKVGEMFFIPDRDTNNMTTYASAVGRKLKRKFQTRLVWMRKTKSGWDVAEPDTTGAVQGIGVWRTE